MPPADLQTTIDSPKLWAHQYFKNDPNASPEAIDIQWMDHLEKSLESVNHNQWLAYQVLKGNVSNWKSATTAANWEVIEVQSEQLQSFVNCFLESSPQQRRIRFAELEQSLQNNSIALNRLRTFRPLLELDSLPQNTLTRDVQFLMQSAAKVLISKPSDRQSENAKIMSIVAQEPARWEAAATFIRTQSPKINEIAPDLFLRISTYQADQNQFHSDEKASIRRSFLARTRVAMNRSVFFKSAAAIYVGLILLGVAINILASAVKTPSAPVALDKTWELSESQKDAFGELLKKPRSVFENRPGRLPLAEEIILYPEKYSREMKIAPPPPGLVEATARYIKKWEMIATVEGTKGLDKEEKKLRDLLTPLNTTTGVPIVNKAVEIQLQLLQRWREKDGNRLAKTRDSVERVMKGVEDYALPLIERTKGDRDEQ